MPVPSITATWATNATFVSPGDSWDGDPTKVTPPVGKRDEGWEPTEQIPAELLNSWKNLVGQWTVFVDDSLKNLQHLTYWVNAQVKALAFQELADAAVHPNGNEHDAPQLMAVGGTGGNVLRSDRGDFWKVEAGLAMANPTSVAANLDETTSITWVVVGQAQAIETSTDGGVVWTAQTSAIAAGNLVAVRFGNSLFVCLGNTNEIQTSSDGITWITQVNPSGNQLTALHFADGIWVIVGIDTVLTSTDGLTWTDRSSLLVGSPILESVVFDVINGAWIAGGRDALQNTGDPDSSAWKDRSGDFGLQSLQVINGLAYNQDGTVVAVRQSGTAANEIDGIGVSHDGGVTWDVRDYDFGEPDGKLNQVLFEDGRWFVFGVDDAPDGLILTSPRI